MESMSFDLDVIPGSPTPLRWGEIHRMLLRTAPDEGTRAFIGAVPALHELGSNRRLSDDESLNLSSFYYPVFARENTLSLFLEPKHGGWEDADYFNDYARNLQPEAKDSIYKRWEQAGYLTGVRSFGGRARGELKLMVVLATCLAELTSGYVVIQDNGVFSLPVGVYPPDELTSAHRAFES